MCRCEQVTKVKDSVLQLNQKDTDEINQPYHVVQVPPPPDNRLYNRIYSQLVVSTQSSLCTHLNLLSTLRLTHRLERAPPPPDPRSSQASYPSRLVHSISSPQREDAGCTRARERCGPHPQPPD